MGMFSFLGRWGNDALGVTDSMQRQQQYSWDMWHANNTYNTPKAQMERLKEAGLNPMLVYGNGSVSGNTASAVGAGSGSGNSAMSSILSFLNSRAGRELQEKALGFEEQRLYQNLELGQAQIEQVEAAKASVLADVAIKKHNLKVAEQTGSNVGDSSVFNTLSRFGKRYFEGLGDLFHDVTYGRSDGKHPWNSLKDFYKGLSR